MPVEVPEKNLKFDVDAILARVTPKTRLVFIANPNNPTGSYLSHAEMRRLHAGLPENVLLVIDAAYSEYVKRNDYEAGIEMVSAFPNVVMTRTFSKIYGLAGLRIGWAYAPAAVCDVLNRIRGPFNVGNLQARVGAAAIRDQAHVARAVAHNEQWKSWLTEEIRKAGLRVDDSVANFILIHFPPGKKDARAAGRLPECARPDPQACRQLPSARCPAPHRRSRRGQPAGGGRAQGIHGAMMFGKVAILGLGFDRLLAGSCHEARRSGRADCRL